MVDLANLGASDVPLKEAVIKKPPVEQPFQQTKLEWAARNRKQILASGVDEAAGSTVIYQVPDNIEFFLTSASASLVDNAGGIGGVLTGSMFIRNQPSGLVTNLFVLQVNDNNSLVASQTYPMPLKLEQGQEIVLFGSATAPIQGNIQGFEEPKQID